MSDIRKGPALTYGVGIDLGTSFVSAALGDTGGARMVSLSPDVVVPSLACVDDMGILLTGTSALGVAPPERTAQNFKRRLGDPTPLVLGDTAFSPAELMAAQLRDALATITAFVSVPPTTVTLTCPAIWGPYRRERFAEVPRLAGVRDFRLITEPEAAAAHYSAERRLGVGEVVAVYDLGGGTFDTTILRMGHSGMELLGTPEGLEDLGGTDFDDALFTHLDDRLDGALSGADDSSESRAALVRVRAECVRAKEVLSSEESVTVPVRLPSAQHDVTVTRAELEELIRPSVRLTVDALRQTIGSAGIRQDELSAVLLAGGSSRIPLVTQLVSAEFGKPVRATAYPKFTVALGAARIGGPGPAGFATSATGPVADVGTTSAGPIARTTPVSPVSPPTGVPLAPPGRPAATQAPVPSRQLPATRPVYATVRVPKPDDEPTAANASERVLRVPIPVAISAALVVVIALVVALVLSLNSPEAVPAGTAPVRMDASPMLPMPSESASRSTPAPGSGAGATPRLSLLAPHVQPPWNGFVRGPAAEDTQQLIDGDGVEVDAVSAMPRDDGYTVDFRADGRLFLATKRGTIDLTGYERSEGALVIRLKPHTRPSDLEVGMRCGNGCGRGLDATELAQRAPLDTWWTLRIPVSCFRGADVDLASVTAPLAIRASDFNATLSDAEVQPETAQDGPLLSCSDFG